MQDFKQWKQIPQQIFDTCSVYDEKIFKRRRVFNTHSVVSKVLELVCGQGRSYLNVLQDASAAKESPAASSFCNARKKVPARVFSDVREDLLEYWADASPKTEAWKGFRLFAMDGSKLNVPKRLEAEGFYVSPDSYYPHALITTLFRLSDRMICDLDFSSHLSERKSAYKMLSNLNRKDLVIYDKGFFSFVFLCDHIESGAQALFKVQGGQGFKEIDVFRASSEEELIVEISSSKTTRAAFRKARPGMEIPTPKIRLIKHRYEDEVHIFATTILDKSISRLDFIDLYYERWKIEELFKALKNTLVIEEFHSKSGNGVEQELHAASIIWNISRMLEDFAPDDFKKNLELLSFIAIPS